MVFPFPTSRNGVPEGIALIAGTGARGHHLPSGATWGRLGLAAFVGGGAGWEAGLTAAGHVLGLVDVRVTICGSE